MFEKFNNWFRNSTELEKAIVFSIVIGIGITAVLILEIKEERFSSLYIYPDSYTNYPAGSSTSFIYGIKSYEKENTSYDLEIFIGSSLLDKKHIELSPGEVHEERESLKIPNVRFPVQVKLILKSPFKTYDAHYWLKKLEETTPVPIKTPQSTPTPVATPNTSAVPNTTVVPNATVVPAPAFTPSRAGVVIDIVSGFSPAKVTINVSDSVIWANKDRRERKFTLVSQEGLFTHLLDIDKRFEFNFNASGTYTFYLKEYPNIKGVVTVS